MEAFALCRNDTASWQCGQKCCDKPDDSLSLHSSVTLTLHPINQPCPLCMATLFLSGISLIVTPSHKVRPLSFPQSSSSMEPLSSVLTSLSCCGSRSQCKGLPSLDPRVCVSAQFLLHGNPPSPMLCLFIAQLSLFSQCCIVGKREEERTRRGRDTMDYGQGRAEENM